ncbi:hypothetical protein ALC57_17632 [Trachymyrmex cornetzi]|uniref:Double jelly roll-like domain-containing protein n=1 Tax=Trachymyrmex cornetzi TaxID=471704 RepID=A0A151IT98_9HYME|nr:hypothetical protein ALC57_17632 [Trachymyrmex cornetzi]
MTDILNIKDEPIFDDRIVKIELLKIQWRMPHVLLSEINKLAMLRALESGRYLSMAFCSWDLYEFPLLQSTTKHSWAIKTATQLEKPRYSLEPNLTFTTFLRHGPFVIIDCPRQNKSVKSGTVDVRLDFECKENVPANTTAYCLIHDRVVQYNPLTNVVRKIT